MNFFEWVLSTGATAIVLVGVIAFARQAILTRIAKSIEHEFNEKLETIRSQLRESEERFKADLRAKESEITLLRSGAMSALASRQAAIDKRRIEAVEQIWSSVTALAPAKGISSSLSIMKLDAISERVKNNDHKMVQFLDMVGKGYDHSKLDLSSATMARPFVTPTVWASYSAVLAATMHGVIRLQSLQAGEEPEKFADNKAIAKLIKAALPHAAEYVDQVGPSSYYQLLEQLEEKLLGDLQDMMNGKEADIATIQRSAEIIEISNAITQQSMRPKE